MPRAEDRTFVIGTRGSRLAVWQAEHVAGRLREILPGASIRLEPIRTTGDKILDVPLAQVGGKALFVKEIEEALLAGTVDLAVHSMKDVPTDLPEGLLIAAIPPREDPSDVVISRVGRRLVNLPCGARVGTSSLRRQAQLLAFRPDLRIVALRGNLDTRIRKLHDEGLEAIVLAAAGVKRLGLEELVAEVVPPEVLLPAIGQGALGIEVRVPSAECRVPNNSADKPRAAGREPRRECRALGAETGGPRAAGRDGETLDVAAIARALDHHATHVAVRAERAMLRRLGGGCQVPIAALATAGEDGLSLSGLIAATDGTAVVKGAARGTVAEPETLGIALAEDLLERGGRVILERLLGGQGRG